MAAEEAKGRFTKESSGDQAASGWRRRNRAGSRRDAPAGTCWDRSPIKGVKPELHSLERGGGGGWQTGKGTPVGTAAASDSPGRILLSRMGCAQVWGVAASPWFPLRYPSRTEHHPLARGKERSVTGRGSPPTPNPTPTPPPQGSLTHGRLPLLVIQAVGVRFGLLAGRARAGDAGNIGEVTRRGLGHGGVAAVQQELAVIDDPGAWGRSRGEMRGRWGGGRSGPAALLCRSTPSGTAKDLRHGLQGEARRVACRRSSRSYLGPAGDNSALDKHPRQHLGTSCPRALAAVPRGAEARPTHGRGGNASPGRPTDAAPRNVPRLPGMRDAPTLGCQSGARRVPPPLTPREASSPRCPTPVTPYRLPPGPSAPSVIPREK